MDYTLSREDLIMLTSEWKGERFEDGRPKVPKSTLERIKRWSLCEIDKQMCVFVCYP